MSWDSHVPAAKIGTPGVYWKWTYRISSDGGKAERHRGRAMRRWGGVHHTLLAAMGDIVRQFVCLNGSNPNIYFLAHLIVQYRRTALATVSDTFVTDSGSPIR